MLGIIGGSGFYNLGKKIETEDVITPYGHAEVQRAKLARKEVLFIARHGKGHTIPPHKINYKANLYALKKLGVTVLFATYASGIISKYKPGDMILVEDFIGLSTPITFFDDFTGGIKHIDFTDPFGKRWQQAVLRTAAIQKIKLKKGGIVATTYGPRYETKAEVKALKKLGANLINMTNAYETTLAHELEIPLAAIAIGTNYAAGIKKKALSSEEVLAGMSKAKPKINAIVQGLMKHVETRA